MLRADQPSAASHPIRNLGWQVTLTGLGINLALGVLYSWSVIKGNIPDAWNWDPDLKAWPYSIACLVFALMMVLAGRMQDKIGPRWVAGFGGLLVGIGMIVCSFTTSFVWFVVGFGVLVATGIGFGYASATPPAVKWFPAARAGLIAGLVVSGFGLASVYIAPLTEWLIGRPSLQLPGTLLVLGIGFLVVVVGLSQLLVAPPKGYVPAGAAPVKAAAVAKKENFRPMEMLSTWQFWVLWFMYAAGAGAGLMVIGNLKPYATDVSGLTQDVWGIAQGAILVACLAVGNGAGRVIAGMASDKLGRLPTFVACFLMQAVMMVLLAFATKGSPLASFGAMAVFSVLIGAYYGANLALFPSITKDYYGLENFGVNYGLVFTAWGVGGFVLNQLAGYIQTYYTTLGPEHVAMGYIWACYIAAVVLVLAAGLTFLVRPPHHAAHADGKQRACRPPEAATR